MRTILVSTGIFLSMAGLPAAAQIAKLCEPLKAVAGACATDVYDYCSLFSMRAAQSIASDRDLKPLNVSYDTKVNEWKARSKQNRAIDCNTDLPQMANDWKQLPENKRPPSFKALVGNLESQELARKQLASIPKQNYDNLPKQAPVAQQQAPKAAPAPVAQPQPVQQPQAAKAAPGPAAQPQPVQQQQAAKAAPAPVAQPQPQQLAKAAPAPAVQPQAQAAPQPIRLTLNDVTQRTWQFGRNDLSVIAPRIQLMPDGKISGYASANEARWGLDNGMVVFYDSKGVPTTKFVQAVRYTDKLLLQGLFAFDPRVTHRLTELGAATAVK